MGNESTMDAMSPIDNKNSQKNGKIWINKVSVWY